VDLSTVHGTGPDGRIVRRDVEAAAERRAAAPAAQVPAAAPAMPRAEASETLRAQAAPPPSAEAAEEPRPQPQPAPARPTAGVQPLSRMRQAIARRMAQSKREAPHYYVTIEVDMTEAMALREALNETDEAQGDSRVSVNDMVVKACAEALRRFPAFNASFTDGGLRLNERINICIAIALPDGLIAPALLDLNEKSLGAIAREAKDLANRARGGALRGPELNDGTFTVSNLGMYGIKTLIPIIQPGQAAILGAGAVQDRPAAREGQIVVRKLMTIALAADHRVTDGAQGAEFVREIKNLLEHPVRLAL
jgi:pyruvate dehydrogenase E2 component (dihydrolipoamide acetyltransferase)